ncbi:MAG: ABC transporter permease [Solirubrobacteraceae bacterium]
MRRDAAIFVSYRFRTVTPLVGLLFTLTTFFYVSKLVRPEALGSQGRYFAFVVLGVITASLLTSALGSAQIIRTELMAGNFERIVVSPLGPVWGVIAVAAFPICYAITLSGITVGAATLLYGIPIHAGGIGPAVGVGLLGSLCLSCIGLLFVAGMLAFKSSLAVTWVVAGLSLIGGAYFPVRLFPGWIRWVADIQPFTPMVDLLRHFLIGIRMPEPLWLEWVKLIGFAAVLAPVAALLLWLAIDLSRRRGTLLEY